MRIEASDVRGHTEIHSKIVQPMTAGKALDGKPCSGNPYAWFDAGEVASCTAEASLRRGPCRRQPEGCASRCAATPRRESLLYDAAKTRCGRQHAKKSHAALSTLALAAICFVIAQFSLLNWPDMRLDSFASSFLMSHVLGCSENFASKEGK